MAEWFDDLSPELKARYMRYRLQQIANGGPPLEPGEAGVFKPGEVPAFQPTTDPLMERVRGMVGRLDPAERVALRDVAAYKGPSTSAVIPTLAGVQGELSAMPSAAPNLLPKTAMQEVAEALARTHTAGALRAAGRAAAPAMEDLAGILRAAAPYAKGALKGTVGAAGLAGLYLGGKSAYENFKSGHPYIGATDVVATGLPLAIPEVAAMTGGEAALAGVPAMWPLLAAGIGGAALSHFGTEPLAYSMGNTTKEVVTPEAAAKAHQMGDIVRAINKVQPTMSSTQVNEMAKYAMDHPEEVQRALQGTASPTALTPSVPSPARTTSNTTPLGMADVIAERAKLGHINSDAQRQELNRFEHLLGQRGYNGFVGPVGPSTANYTPGSDENALKRAVAHMFALKGAVGGI